MNHRGYNSCSRHIENEANLEQNKGVLQIPRRQGLGRSPDLLRPHLLHSAGLIFHHPLPKLTLAIFDNRRTICEEATFCPFAMYFLYITNKTWLNQGDKASVFFRINGWVSSFRHVHRFLLVDFLEGHTSYILTHIPYIRPPHAM